MKLNWSTTKLNTIVAGAMPKVNKSAKESNWAPNSDSTFNNLAANPSIKSKKAAKTINNKAIPI